MDIALQKINQSSPDLKKARQLYRAAFPLPERAPFFLLAKRAKESHVDWWGIYDRQRWVGFFYVLKDLDIAYLFFFAILESERGKGYGSRALEALKERYQGCRVFLAIEEIDEGAKNAAERVKRKQFYEKSGFEALPARIREGFVVYEMMGIGGPVSRQEYGRLLRRWLGPVFSRLVKTEIMP